ncbi:MAG: hypothetical protein PHN69_07305 [Candidatus Pacebacteria bacterium]|nr:hypothetical protein [Fermentimonas sp.]MDD4804931.1 hypothetical protein [Candidatus Paceibacterota bacterium]
MKDQILSGWIGEKIEKNIEEFIQLFRDRCPTGNIGISYAGIVKLAIEKTKLEVMDDLGPNDYSEELDNIADALRQ